MKNNFDRTKTATARFSTRAIAMMLFFVMLLTAIGSGSVLSAIATETNDAALADAVTQAATKGSNIALNAISSEDATVDNAESKPDLSGLEENEIVRGMKNDLAKTAANNDLAQTGEDTTYYLFISTNQSPGEWNNYVTSTDLSFTFTASQAGLASFETGKNYYVGISSSDKIANMWSQTSDNSAAIGTKDSNISNAYSQSFTYGDNTYNFAMFSLGKVVDSVTVSAAFTKKDNKDITTYSFSTGSAADTGWYLVNGDTNWQSGVANQKFTYNATSGYYEKTVNWKDTQWFRVANGSTQYSGNNSTSDNSVITASDSFSGLVANTSKSFEFAADSTAKDYLIQIDNGSKMIRIKEVSTYTFSLPTVEHAVVKATYNGTTINEGGTLTDLPSGATITINVTPDSLYTCDEMSCSVNGSVIAPTGAAIKYTFTMPAANVPASAISFDLRDQSNNTRTVYFNNYYTKYENVFAYAKTSSGLEPLGPWAGTGMTKLANTNTYSIEVPYSVDKIFFIGYINPNSYSTGELTIPWSTYHDKPKYTPIDASDPTITTGGGTWGEYVARTNEYTVSDGDTIKNKTNIYTGITATLYDYYTDSEVAGEWITDISDDDPKDYTHDNNASNTKWNPYQELNHALSKYASDFSVDKPLYFGNLNNKDGGDAVVKDSYTNKKYTNWNTNANNSIYLHPASTAITGLAGSTMTNSTIHYAGTNGAEMAMFDEDFLSGENDKGKVLATILRSPSFPVRKEENVKTVSSITKLHLDPTGGSWTDGNAVFDAYFWGTNLSGTWRQFSGSGTDYVANIPGGAEKVIITRNGSHVESFSAWNQSEDISLTLSGSSAVNKVKFTGWSGSKGTFSTSLVTSLSGCTLTSGHTYYEYDSTGGKDNAYITNIDSTEHTAKIDYYANDAAWSGGTSENKQGFFPFDYANKGHLAKDLGFGMKLEIPFTLNENGLNTDGSAQTFDFSGDDDLWVFVDDKLVLDLGGAHSRTTGSINFNTKQASMDTAAAISSVATSTNVTGAAMTSDFNWFNNTNPNTIHTMTIYYMERGMFDSNLKFGFSFHAIPNLLRTEKKVRTNGANGSTRINSGFFTANSADRSNIGDSGKTLFEESFNADQFSFLQEYSTDGTGTTYTTASGKNYTIGSESDNLTVDPEGTYDMVNDRVVNFLGEFAKDNYIRLTETPHTDAHYTYDQKLLLFDDAVSTTEPLAEDTYITKTSDGAVDHYAFKFSESAPSQSALDNLRLRARFENMMRAHTLTLRKAITGTDDNEQFMIKVLFQFPGSSDYIVYPAYYKKFDKNGNEINGNLDPATGAVTLAANEYIELSGIPEKTMIKVVEDLSGNTSYNYVRTSVLEESGDTVDADDLTDGEKGVTFTMYDEDQTATVYNSKQLILTHTLHPNNRPDDGSMASTYISYRILDSNEKVLFTSGEVKNGPLTVDGTHLASGSSNRLEVTLRTALADFINFKEFSVQDGGDTYSGDNYYKFVESNYGLYSSFSTKNHNADSTEYTLKNTYTISQLFDGGKLKTNTLDYFSEVEKPQFKYEITYTYPAYVKSYGPQSYTYTGTFTDYELNKYMEYRNLIIDRKDKTAGSDTETFFKTLVNNNAPYEKNFRTFYDFSTANIGYLSSTASSGVYKMTVNVTADPTRVTATFVLPYAIESNTHCVPVVSDGNKVYKAQSESRKSYTVFSHDWVNTKGKRNPKDDSTTVEPEFIRPALIYYDGSTAYYFQYWSVATESSYKSAAKEYTRCYDSSFNLTIFQNCTVTPVYSTTPWNMPGPPTAWDNYERFDPDVMHNTDKMGQQDPDVDGLSNEITVAFMENSRNQYNHNGGGNIADARKGAGDRIYSDFLLSYNNIAGNQQLNLLAAGSKKVGLVISPVGEEVTPAEGTKTEAEYAAVHGSYLSADDYNALKKYLSKSGSTDGYQFASAEFDVSELDNKNRIQYYFGINNKSFVAYDSTNLPELLDSYANNHYKVFRAYAYIVDCNNGTPNWDTLKVNNAATYFTIYDIGSIQNGSKAD